MAEGSIKQALSQGEELYMQMVPDTSGVIPKNYFCGYDISLDPYSMYKITIYRDFANPEERLEIQISNF